MASVSENKGAKPFPKRAGLSGNGVEFSWKAIGAYRCGCVRGNKLGSFKPSHKVLSVCQPFDYGVDRRAN